MFARIIFLSLRYGHKCVCVCMAMLRVNFRTCSRLRDGCRMLFVFKEFALKSL